MNGRRTIDSNDNICSTGLKLKLIGLIKGDTRKTQIKGNCD